MKALQTMLYIKGLHNLLASLYHLLYYKIASLYFGSGEYVQAIEYLNLIIQHKELSLREDLQCFARILNLIAHYESGDDASLDYQIRSVYHFLGKMDD